MSLKRQDKSKEVEVGCAVIRNKGKILIAQRKAEVFYGGYWEFPGGKREEGESLEDCLVREVREELRIKIRPVRFIRRDLHPGSNPKLWLDFYLCDWVSGEPERVGCQDFRWVTPEELVNYRFPPADDGLIRDLIEKKKEYLGS